MKEKRMKIKDLFKDNKDFLENDGYFIYEELDPEAKELGCWCVCQRYSDFNTYTQFLVGNIWDQLKEIKVTFDDVYTIDFIRDVNVTDKYPFRFRKVENGIDAWDVAIKDGFPDTR